MEEFLSVAVDLNSKLIDQIRLEIRIASANHFTGPPNSTYPRPFDTIRIVFSAPQDI
jgi:hypothetical protein